MSGDPSSKRGPTSTSASVKLLRGKYRVLESLGEGGMAVVHAGINVLTERPVAIKRLLSQHANEPTLRARFEREARAAGRIQSPHIVEIIDIDQDADGTPFLVMERLRGEPLAEKIRREKKLPAGEAIAITQQILAGIREAHKAGVVHRDLKPSNVFLEAPELGGYLVKIVDFGISKIRDDDTAELTRDGQTLGTFSYMPPEQIRKITTAGPQADLWAIGITLFRMLAGHNPFRSVDSLGLLASILEHPPERLADSGVAKEVVAALEPVILRALEKDPARRYASAEEMSKDLDRASRTLATGVPPLIASPEPTSEPTLSPSSIMTLAPSIAEAPTRAETVAGAPELESTEEAIQLSVIEAALPRKRRSLTLGLGLFCATMLGGLAAWSLFSSRAAPTSGQPYAAATMAPTDGAPANGAAAIEPALANAATSSSAAVTQASAAPPESAGSGQARSSKTTRPTGNKGGGAAAVGTTSPKPSKKAPPVIRTAPY